MEAIDFGYLLDLLAVIAVMREGVMRIGHADLGVGPVAGLARQLEGDDAGDIGLEGQDLQVEHQAGVVGVGGGHAHGALEVPAWVKQGFQYAYRRGVYEQGLKSWDEVFGSPPKDARRQSRYLPKQWRVLKEVERVKAAGISLNEEEFGAIGSRLGVGGSSTVKQLYADAKREFWWLKYLKR